MPIRSAIKTTNVLNSPATGSFDKLSAYVVLSDSSQNQLLRQRRRVHGLQLPLHLQQITGWIVSIFLVVFIFWCLLPTFSISLRWTSYAIFIPLLIVYIGSHLFVVFLGKRGATKGH